MAMLTITLLLGAAGFAVADPSTPASQHFQSPECTGDFASSCSIEHDKTSLLQVQGTIELGSARSANGLESKLDTAKQPDPIEDLSDAEDDEQSQQLATNAEEGFQARTFDRVKTDLATGEVADEEARRQTTGDRLETTLTEDEIAGHEAHRLQAAEMAHAARKEIEQVAAETDDINEHVNADKEYAGEHMEADAEATEVLRAKADAQAEAQGEAERQSEGEETYMANHNGAMGGAYRGHALMSSSGQGMDTSVQEGMVDDNRAASEEVADRLEHDMSD